MQQARPMTLTSLHHSNQCLLLESLAEEGLWFQVDCDFSIRVVHASAADLDLERLWGPEAKKPGTSRYRISGAFPDCWF